MAEKFLTQSEILNKSFQDLGDGSGRLNVAGNLSLGGTLTKNTYSHDLSTAPFEAVLTQASQFNVKQIMIQASDSLSQTLSIYYDNNGDGLNLEDGVILSRDFINNKSFFWSPTINFVAGDALRIRITNNGNPNVTLSVTVMLEVL